MLRIPLLPLFIEPEGFHFGASNELRLAVWRSTDEDDDADSDSEDEIDSSQSSADMDKIALGFMTWQPNATLLHYASESTRDMLKIKLVSLVYLLMF